MDVEQRARELLAAEYAKGQFRAYAAEIRDGTTVAFDEEIRAIVAIIAALTPREGYVLVPVDVQKDADRYRWLRHYNVDSYLAGGSGEQLDLSIDAAMLYARPEVKP